MLLCLIYYAKSRTFNVEEQTIERKLCMNKHLKNKTKSITYSVAQTITDIYALSMLKSKPYNWDFV